jgi:cyclic pyranopterin phosphate synthase
VTGADDEASGDSGAARDAAGAADEHGASDAPDADRELTHTDAEGDARMVDVGEKAATNRRAVARGELHLRPGTIDAVRANEVGKGDVLAVARVGAVQAVKHTWEAIPMCHQIPVTDVEAEFTLAEDRVALTVAVETTARTGPEMEALEGVTTGLNVVWDMVKSAEKDEDGQYPDTAIRNVRVLEKESGR